MTIQPWETDPAAVAYQFITSDGQTSPEQVTHNLIGESTSYEFAQSCTHEAFDTWNMHVSREDFYAACLDFIADRPDIAENDA